MVRSTLSAEAYSIIKSVNLLGWIRALWGVVHVPNFKWSDSNESFKQLHAGLVVTDCKSLYDLVTRTAIPSCEEYRTTLDGMSCDLIRRVLALGRFKLHDERCTLAKSAHRKEVLTWLGESGLNEYIHECEKSDRRTSSL